MRHGSDATAIGTAVHSAIEGYLTGTVDSLGGMLELARHQVDVELARPGIKMTDISSDMDKMYSCVDSMVTAWWVDIRPSVTPGGLVEYKFKTPLVEPLDGSPSLWLEGTMDYVAPDGTIWDWKTASRVYYAKEKQKQSHQATCYVAAARELGIVSVDDQPTLFRFGVMVRQITPKAQIVTVARDASHVAWLKRQVNSVTSTALGLSLSNDWAMNDQHNLCSSKWCDYWTMCKGVHWSDGSVGQLDPPDQSVAIVVSGD
jgi:hypothetical protein